MPEESTPENSIAVFPNPADKQLNVEAGELGDNANILIYNNAGTPVMNSMLPENKTMVDIVDFPSGIYMIRLSNDKGVVTRKFLKK